MRASFAWICVATLLAAGCGDSHGGSSGGGPVPVDQVGNELATALCSYLERCPVADNDTQGARIVLESSATLTCSEAFLASTPGFATQVARRVAAGTITYDAAQARTCVDTYRSSCVPPASSELSPAACRNVVEGTRAIGQGCHDSDECAGDAYCSMAGASGCGTCAARVSIGASCSSAAECQKDGLAWGSVCETPPGGPGHCVELRVVQNVAAGAGCARVSEDANVRTVGVCASGLYCTETGYTAAGTCASPVAVGMACENANVPCVGDAMCLPAAAGRTCQAVTIHTRVGETCDDAMFTLCNPLDRLTCVAGLCQASGDGAAGSMCMGGDFRIPCNDGLYCDSTTMRCTAQKPDGATCSSDRECTTGTCGGATCGLVICPA